MVSFIDLSEYQRFKIPAMNLFFKKRSGRCMSGLTSLLPRIPGMNLMAARSISALAPIPAIKEKKLLSCAQAATTETDQEVTQVMTPRTVAGISALMISEILIPTSLEHMNMFIT
jgi:hypothetical protein